MDEITKEGAAINASSKAYEALIGLYEGLEARGLIIGNGHHAAQKIAEHVADDIKQRWNE